MDLTALSSPVSPEIDTVRFYWPCSACFDPEAFFPASSCKMVMSVQRDSSGNVVNQWEKWRSEMRCSWWGKMSVTKEVLSFGAGSSRHLPCMCFEYSVAKWYNVSNGVNNGETGDFRAAVLPVLDVIGRLGLADFSGRPIGVLREHFVRNAILRRFDLSLNFRVPSGVATSDVVRILARIPLNRGDTSINSSVQGRFETISWGGPNSPYKVMFYDKYEEQKKYFAKNDVDNSSEVMYFKKKFWDENEGLFKGVLRFEVQFGAKWIKNHKMDATGYKNMENCVSLGIVSWRKLLDHFSTAAGRGNFKSDDGRGSIDYVLSKMDDDFNQGILARNPYSRLSSFLVRCFRVGWRKERASMSQQLFSKYYCELKKLYNFDVKVSLPEEGNCPIMGIM